jgi:hypothetical protein
LLQSGPQDIASPLHFIVDEVRNDEAHYGTLCGGVEEHFEKELERAGQQILPLGWGGRRSMER